MNYVINVKKFVLIVYPQELKVDPSMMDTFVGLTINANGPEDL